MDERTLKEFRDWKKTPSSHDPHGDADQIQKNLQRLLPNSWVLEGNALKGKTSFGTLVQMIPTNYVLKGTDEDGLPILEKIDA